MRLWWLGVLATAIAACHAPHARNTAPEQPAIVAPSTALPVPPAPESSPLPSVSAQPSGEARITAPLLFAATRDGRTTYLLGTLHMGVDAKHQLPPWVWHYFTGATTFAMEADANDSALQQAMFRSDGSSLRSELGDSTWRRIETVLGAPEARALDDLTVPMATTAIALTGLPETQPMDAAFADAAKAQRKPIAFLESMTVQLRFAIKWMDATALTAMLDDFALVPQRNRELLQAYLLGELSGLTQVVSDGRRDFVRGGRPASRYDAMLTELLSERNHMWVPVVERLHRTGTSFIAVGALHLPGPDGLIALLGRRGFVVTRLKQP